MGLADIAVIGGSGFYRLPLEGERRLTLQTPYGPMSDSVTLGRLGGRNVAFLPRHGREHQLPPHRIPYRANLYSLKELGVTQIVGCCAVGALTAAHEVGSFASAQQLVDWTHGTRADTFYDGPLTTHVDFSEPYCPAMREALQRAAAQIDLPLAAEATLVVTAGPRFSTRAEAGFFAAQGWQLENMTQYPEAALARELNLSYANLSLVTNSHAVPDGDGDGEAGVAPGVISVLRQMLPRLHALLAALLPLLPAEADRPEFIRQAQARGRWV
jgi:5'-methylthioadenosine phosphorylase